MSDGEPSWTFYGRIRLTKSSFIPLKPKFTTMRLLISWVFLASRHCPWFQGCLCSSGLPTLCVCKWLRFSVYLLPTSWTAPLSLRASSGVELETVLARSTEPVKGHFHRHTRWSGECPGLKDHFRTTLVQRMPVRSLLWGEIAGTLAVWPVVVCFLIESCAPFFSYAG